MFRMQGIPAAAINRRIDGQQCEIDCVVLWDRILFVFECKNYSLPGDNAQSEYWFTVQQASAARQASIKADVLRQHPEVVAEAELKVTPDWVQIAPGCVEWHALPRAQGLSTGSTFYDASALHHRFFDKGQVGFQTRGYAAEWNDDAALTGGASEPRMTLLKQLASPAQEALIRQYYDRRRIEFPISERLAVNTVTHERKPTVPALIDPEGFTAAPP